MSRIQQRLPNLHMIGRGGSVHGERLALWYLEKKAPRGFREPILFIHGATVPTVMSPGYQIHGSSWFDLLAAQGFDVWGLDFPGIGASDDYGSQLVTKTDIRGTARDNADDILAAAQFILNKSDTDKLHLVAISRGTLPAGYFLTENCMLVRSVVFLSPIVVRSRDDAIDQSAIAKELLGTSGRPTAPYYSMSLAKRLELLDHDRPSGTDRELDPFVMSHWVADYTDFHRQIGRVGNVESMTGNLGGAILVEGKGDSAVPGGFAVDLFDTWNGRFYEAHRILTPMLAIRGDYDRRLTTAYDMVRLFELLSGTKEKRFVTIDRATHSLQLERVRQRAFDQVSMFLSEHTQ